MADPYFNDILLLSPFDEADGTASGWTDYSANANTWTKTDSGGTPCTIETSNAVQLFGANALHLKKAVSDKEEHIYINSTDYGLTTADAITIEYWYYHVSSSNFTTSPLVFRMLWFTEGDTAQEFIDGRQYATTANHQFVFHNNSLPNGTSGYSITTAEWHHIAIVMDSPNSLSSVYIDGVRQNTSASYITTDRPKATVFINGITSGTTTNGWECYIADLRITKAIRYTGESFDVPTERFQTQPDAEEQPLKTWHYVPGPVPWFN